MVVIFDKETHSTLETIHKSNHTKHKHSGQSKVTKTDLTDVFKTLVQVTQT